MPLAVGVVLVVLAKQFAAGQTAGEEERSDGLASGAAVRLASSLSSVRLRLGQVGRM